MVNSTRPVRFELHIRPLVRLLDQDRMLIDPAKRIDLWDYDQVRLNADKIINRLKADMPPGNYGGPWPQEWIALFQRWKDEGFLRLQVGSADANEYRASRTGTIVSVTGQGKFPAEGFQAWLDPFFAE